MHTGITQHSLVPCGTTVSAYTCVCNGCYPSPASASASHGHSSIAYYKRTRYTLGASKCLARNIVVFFINLLHDWWWNAFARAWCLPRGVGRGRRLSTPYAHASYVRGCWSRWRTSVSRAWLAYIYTYIDTFILPNYMPRAKALGNDFGLSVTITRDGGVLRLRIIYSVVRLRTNNSRLRNGSESTAG